MRVHNFFLSASTSLRMSFISSSTNGMHKEIYLSKEGLCQDAIASLSLLLVCSLFDCRSFVNGRAAIRVGRGGQAYL